MSTGSVLTRAKKALKARRFPLVISLLEKRVIEFRDSFDFFIVLGTACMYVGDMGGATTYFKRARQLKMCNPQLLVAQAALFLREGNTSRAIEYYLEALDYEPNNKKAKSALKFIRHHGDIETIQDWVERGKIKKFYPDLGVNPAVPAICISVFTAIAVLGVLFLFTKIKTDSYKDGRADLSSLTLSGYERQNAVETDMSGSSYRYILSAKEITNSYDNIRIYFNQYRDNAAQVEINRILNSNASSQLRQKARLFMEYLKPQTFDTIKDNYSYAEVALDPRLYLDCYVLWSGRISNIVKTEQVFSCDLLVGYESFQKVDGIVPVVFANFITIDAEKAVKVLGKIGIRDGKVFLQNAAVYQPVDGGLQTE